MLGNPGSSHSDPSSFGMSYLFFRMSPKFREELVREALLWRDQASPEARTILRQAVSESISVEGFRSAGLAPATLLLDPVTDHVSFRSDLAGAILRIWVESKEVIWSELARHLNRLSVSTQAFDFPNNQIPMGRSSKLLMEARSSFLELHPALGEEGMTLMMDLITGSIVSYAPEGCGSDDSLEGTLDRVLELIGSLPPDAPEWSGVIQNFQENLGELVESKSQELLLTTTLDREFAAVREQFAEFIEFFQWDSGIWATENLAERHDLKRAHELITGLQEALFQYAAIHERAPAAAEEMERATLRLELLPQVLESGRALDAMMESGGGNGVDGSGLQQIGHTKVGT